MQIENEQNWIGAAFLHVNYGFNGEEYITGYLDLPFCA